MTASERNPKAVSLIIIFNLTLSLQEIWKEEYLISHAHRNLLGKNFKFI